MTTEKWKAATEEQKTTQERKTSEERKTVKDRKTIEDQTASEDRRAVEQTMIEGRKRTAACWIGPVGSIDCSTYELHLIARTTV